MTNPSVKVTVGEVEYNLAAITLDQAEEALDPSLDIKKQLRQLVGLSLQNGGQVVDVGSLPFVHYAELRDAAIKLNGLTENKSGEATAPAQA